MCTCFANTIFTCKLIDMSDLSNDRIVINNIKNNEVIHYPLVLLKGTIEHHNCKESSNPSIFNCSIDHYVVSKDSTNPPKTKFKVLLELKLGENRVDIDFCCSSISMNLTYKKRKSRFNLIPMYIINAGHCGKFQAADTENNTPESACKRILIGCKLLQCLIAEKLYEEGLGRKTFQVENDECVIFHSNLNYKTARKMNQERLWEYLGREIMNSKIGDENKKYLGFLSCTKYNAQMRQIQSYEDMIRVTQGHVALGGGGLALFGSACLYTWPENVGEIMSRFQDHSLVDKQKFMDDSCYRGTHGACFTTTLGSVLHELCHTFDLGHTRDGIMDRGFDNIHKFFISYHNNSSSVKEEHLQIRSNCTKSDVTIAMESNGIIRNPNCVQTNCIRKKADDTYFTRSCSVILFYHKYFNDYGNRNYEYILTFNRNTYFVRSTLGIRVIEIRKGTNEIVEENWIFPTKVLKYSFYIPEDCLSDNVTIFVEDNAGNILKQLF